MLHVGEVRRARFQEAGVLFEARFGGDGERRQEDL